MRRWKATARSPTRCSQRALMRRRWPWWAHAAAAAGGGRDRRTLTHTALMKAVNRDGTHRCFLRRGRPHRYRRPLLAHGANAKAADKDGWTSLHDAAMNGTARWSTRCSGRRRDGKATGEDHKGVAGRLRLGVQVPDNRRKMRSALAKAEGERGRPSRSEEGERPVDALQ